MELFRVLVSETSLSLLSLPFCPLTVNAQLWLRKGGNRWGMQWQAYRQFLSLSWVCEEFWWNGWHFRWEAGRVVHARNCCSLHSDVLLPVRLWPGPAGSALQELRGCVLLTRMASSAPWTSPELSSLLRCACSYRLAFSGLWSPDLSCSFVLTICPCSEVWVLGPLHGQLLMEFQIPSQVLDRALALSPVLPLPSSLHSELPDTGSYCHQ